MENKTLNLITCKDCGKEYSKRANSCPNCSCPTEYNIEQPKRENVKCEVEITGEEVYGIQTPSFVTWIIGLIPLIIMIIVSIKEGEGLYLIGYFPAIFWIIITINLERWIGINYKKKKKKAEKIMKYFKKTIPLFLDVKANQEIVDTINVTEKTYDTALFKIYMKAYLEKVDGIVITANNVSEEVDGTISTTPLKGVHGEIKSSTQNHLTAVLVKNI